jgi:hypothetical protein
VRELAVNHIKKSNSKSLCRLLQFFNFFFTFRVFIIDGVVGWRWEQRGLDVYMVGGLRDGNERIENLMRNGMELNEQSGLEERR